MLTGQPHDTTVQKALAAASTSTFTANEAYVSNLVFSFSHLILALSTEMLIDPIRSATHSDSPSLVVSGSNLVPTVHHRLSWDLIWSRIHSNVA